VLRELLLRLDSLSHCLVWLTTSDPNHAAVVDLVELPRLKLTFRSRATTPQAEGDARAASRLYLDGHGELFLSNGRAPGLCKFLEGLPTAVLLENDLGEAFILLPATPKPARLQVQHQLHRTVL
jgi:hypothetical protein